MEWLTPQPQTSRCLCPHIAGHRVDHYACPEHGDDLRAGMTIANGVTIIASAPDAGWEGIRVQGIFCPDARKGDRQKELQAKHGTPEEFAKTCNRAADDLMITTAECQAGIEKYNLEWQNAGLIDKVESLENFKSYVHRRLDEAGIPVDPESPHRAAGCRIGGRLDIVLSRTRSVTVHTDGIVIHGDFQEITNLDEISRNIDKLPPLLDGDRAALEPVDDRVEYLRAHAREFLADLDRVPACKLIAVDSAHALPGELREAWHVCAKWLRPLSTNHNAVECAADAKTRMKESR